MNNLELDTTIDIDDIYSMSSKLKRLEYFLLFSFSVLDTNLQLPAPTEDLLMKSQKIFKDLPRYVTHLRFEQGTGPYYLIERPFDPKHPPGSAPDSVMWDMQCIVDYSYRLGELYHQDFWLPNFPPGIKTIPY